MFPNADMPSRILKTRDLLLNWIICLGILGFFIAVFLLLRPLVGPAATLIMVVPPMIVSWFMGLRAGLFFTFLTAAIVFTLIIVTTGMDVGTLMFRNGGAVGLGVMLVVALGVGWLASVSRRHSHDLEQARNTEKELQSYAAFFSLLNDILSASLEAEDMSTMLEVLVNRMGTLFHADSCFVTRWDEENRMAVPTMAFGPLKDVYIDTTPTPDEVSLTSSVLEAGRPLAVIDVCNTPYINEKLAAEYPCTSALGLPLMAGERKLGAVILGYEKEYKFSESEIQRSELAAREISLAMMKILSVEDSRQRVREMTGLYEISQTFGLHSEPRLTYGLLTERLASLLGAEMCLVAIKINETNEISARLPAFGVSDEVASRLSYPVSMGAGVWDFSKMGVFRANRPEEIPPQFGKLAADNGIHSVLAAPLWDPNRNLLGMVFAANKQAGFNPSDARLMNIFTAQASVVIQNMNLLTAERRRSKELSVLHDVAQAVTSNDEEKELIVQLAQMIGRNLFPDNFGILLMDEVNNVLHSDGSYFFEDQETQVSFPLDSGITGRVATTGIAIRSGDVTKCEYYVALNERIRSELCVPVKVGERVIGVINAESVLSNAFSQEDEKLLTIIAGQLATAIERLRARQAEDHQTAQVKRSNAFIKALAHVGARASAAADPDSVMQTLGSELTKLGLSCLLALNEPETGRTTIHYTSIHPRIVRLIERVSRRRMRDFVMDLERLAPLVESLHEPALLYDPLVIARQALQDFPEDALRKALRPTGVDENIPICHLPLVYEGKSLGFLWLWGEGLHKSDLPTISIFSSQVAIALENASLMAEVKRLAITDEGTDIFNRRHFFTLAEQEFSRARRYGHALSAMIVDVDLFKRFNDQYGHIVGDQVLRVVAGVLRTSLREIDILGRYGGEEFSVLLPITDLKAARLAADRLQNCVAQARVTTDAGALGVTISIGVAELTTDTPNLLALIDRADRAMYQAKNAGGNQVALYSETPPNNRT